MSDEEKKTESSAKRALPEVTFTNLIMSLNTSTLFHLGEISDPQTGGTNKDLVLAKHSIDTLNVLQEKTKGNLNEEEDKLLQNILYELKLRFVNASGSS